MKDFFGSPEFFNLVISLLAGIWTFFKGTEWYSRLVTDKYQSIVSLVELAVDQIYQTYVRVRKASSDTAPVGKLSEEERVEARSKAVDLVKQLAEQRGLDLTKLVGSDGDVELLVQKVVNDVKLKYGSK